MSLKLYLSGEIHTNWRDQIISGASGLDVSFSAPVTDHEASDDCGVAIMGAEPDKFWHDHKGAKLNAIRTRKAIADSDIVVVRFGDKYRQWNAAFDAGYAAALGKSLIIIHGADHQHALKEVDAAALAIVKTPDEVIRILTYVLTGQALDYTLNKYNGQICIDRLIVQSDPARYNLQKGRSDDSRKEPYTSKEHVGILPRHCR